MSFSSVRVARSPRNTYLLPHNQDLGEGTGLAFAFPGDCLTTSANPSPPRGGADVGYPCRRVHLGRPSRSSASVGTWLSLVERTLGVGEVAGSNPVVPTI